jgi:ABC-2 type transport system ATP-binding protein
MTTVHGYANLPPSLASGVPQRGCMRHPARTMSNPCAWASMTVMQDNNSHSAIGPHAPQEQAGASEPVIVVRDLTKCYGSVVAVQGLSFSLSRGTITGFLGPNGAGKTTTLRILLGLAQPTAGEALVFGCPYQQLERPARRVGAVLESGDFDPGRSGRNHLRALALATRIPDARVDEVLELVELDAAADRPVKAYSLGMRQRLGLAAALLGDPELLVLDEPANGLDAAGIHWLRGFLRQFAAQNRTVLISSHILAEVAQTVDQVLIIDRGHELATVQLTELEDRGSALEDLYLELTARVAA